MLLTNQVAAMVQAQLPAGLKVAAQLKARQPPASPLIMVRVQTLSRLPAFTPVRLPWSLCSRYYTEHMNTGLTFKTVSIGSEQTEQLAEQLGSRLRGGEVIELVGDLGGGKTTFVRGLARGLGSADKVSSPSFTLSNEYRAGSRRLYHFDFYRLNEPGIMKQELAEVLTDPESVTVVEWAGIAEDVLPAGRLTVRFKATGENDRELYYEYPQNLEYLIKS